MRQLLTLSVLALLGLLLAVGATVATSSLSGQSFALESEPLENSGALAPTAPGTAAKVRVVPTPRTPAVVRRTVTVTVPAPTTPGTTAAQPPAPPRPAAPSVAAPAAKSDDASDDSSGSSDDSSSSKARDRSGDDD
jgi:hypothetical protein